MSFVDRYGEALEYDLHHFLGLDLLDFFRGRFTWRKLHALIGKLPSTSLSQEAMAQDDELAGEYSDALADHKDTGPRLAEYSQESQRLDVLTDLMQSMIATLVAVNGGKPSRVRPATRPETAVTRAKAALVAARFTSLLDEVAEAQERWSAKHE